MEPDISPETGGAASTVRRPLPTPELLPLVKLDGLGAAHYALYRFLFERRQNPPTMNEIRRFDRDLALASSDEERSQIDRRVRDLYVYFVITKVWVNGSSAPRYRLDAWETWPKTSKNTRISKALRARILAPRRCAMCGRSPLADNVKLEVDHMLPQAWGGTNDEENLQPLCSECNAGKKAWFSSYQEHSEHIEVATTHAEPQVRIGELLKVFNGDLVPGDLISVVASMGAFQEDWQKRLRELRELGWKIGQKNVRVHGGRRRVRSHYFLQHAEPWPDRPIRESLKEAKKLRDQSKRQPQA